MKYLKLYENFDWDKYADKRDLVENIFPQVTKEFKELKQDCEDSAWFIWDFTRGAWKRGYARETNQEDLLDGLNNVANSLQGITSYIGPRPFGSIRFNMNKRSLLDKLLGRNKGLRFNSGDDSVIGQIISLVGDINLQQELSKMQLDGFAKELWDIHPNNPENQEEEETDEDRLHKGLVNYMIASDAADKRKMMGVDSNFWSVFNADLEKPNFKYGAEQSKNKIKWLRSRIDQVSKKTQELLSGHLDPKSLEKLNDIIKTDIYKQLEKAEDEINEIAK